MKTFKIVERVSAWLRKPIIVCGLVASLAMGTAPAAKADAWSFSYSGAGTNVLGQINAVWDATLAVWDIVSVEGTRNGVAITGLWDQLPGPGNQNYLAGPSFGATLSPPQPGPTYGPGLTYYYDQMDLHFAVGASQYAFGWIVGYNDPVATEGPLSNLDFGSQPVVITGTGRCVVDENAGCVPVQFQIASVPEINASAGLEALALLFVFGLIMRELFLRRRNNASLSA